MTLTWFKIKNKHKIHRKESNIHKDTFVRKVTFAQVELFLLV